MSVEDGGDDGGVPAVVELAPIESITAHGSPVLCVDFSCDSKYFASGSKDKTCKIFDLDTFELVHTLRGHQDRVNAVSFSQQSANILATGSKDKTVRIWRAESGELARTLRGHGGEVLCVAFDHTSKLLASGSADETAILWDVSRGEVIARLESHAAPVTGCSFSRIGRALLATSSEDFTVKIWNTRTKALLKTLKGHEDVVVDVKFSPIDGNLVLSSSRDRSIIAWNVQKGQKQFTIPQLPDVVLEVAFSPDGWLFSAASADTSISLWNIETASHAITLQSHKNSVSACRFSPAGSRIVSGCFDGNIRVWDISKVPSGGRKPDGTIPTEPTLLTPRKSPPMRKRRSLPKVQVSSSLSVQSGGKKGRSSRSLPTSNRQSVHTEPLSVKTPASTSNSSPLHSPSAPLSSRSSTASSHAFRYEKQRSSTSSKVSSRSHSRSTTPTTATSAADDLNQAKSELKAEHKRVVEAEKHLQEDEVAMHSLRNKLSTVTTAYEHEHSSHSAQVKELIERAHLHEAARREVEEKLEEWEESWMLEDGEFSPLASLALGSTSEVFDGIWASSSVCIKVFSEELRSEFFTDVWRRACHSLAKLRHPNIIQFYGAFIHPGHRPSFVLEKAATSLDKLVQLGEKLNCREVADVIIGIVSGIKFMHASGVPHQRLRSSKVLLMSDLTPKIAGVSQSIPIAKSFAHPPATTQQVDTNPNESALKELFAGDIYSVGLISMEMVLNREPQRGSIRRSILDIEWEPISSFANKCTQEDWESRPGSYSLGADLHDHIIGGDWRDYTACREKRFIRIMEHGPCLV